MQNIVQMPMNRTKLADLWEQVLEKHLDPEDDFEVAALLESFGWTDAMVRTQFGNSDVFELATSLRQMHSKPIEIQTNRYREREPFRLVLKQGLREFIRGVVFALPMVISIAAMLTLKFSLWSYEYLDTRTATAIAIGTILSFITVGGFMQAMARQGYFYMFQGHYRMMQRVTLRIIMVGVFTSIFICVLGFAFDIIFPELPYDMLVIAFAYYLVLNAIWLAVAVLYIIRREVWFTVLLSAGIGLVYLGFKVLHLSILMTQIFAMLAVAVGSVILMNYFFRKDEDKKDKGINPALPRVSVTIYNVAPYFFYGMLYYAMLFCDRVIAWSTYSINIPFIIWFRGNYELGLDFALVTLTIPMGLSEIVVSRLMTRIWESQKDYLGHQFQQMNDTFLKLYQRNVNRMWAVSVLNAVGIYFATAWFIKHYISTLPGHVELGPTSTYVFIIALSAYTILSVGLLHSVVMFSVSRPELVVRPILMSLATNFVLGFLLTRWIGYPQAVWGLFAGCVLFTVLTTRHVRDVLSHLDYHMYLLS